MKYKVQGAKEAARIKETKVTPKKFIQKKRKE